MTTQRKSSQESLEGDSDLGSEQSVNDGLMDKDHDHLMDDDGECGPPSERDVVDDALDALIKELTDSGYDDEDAEDAVFSALEQLHTVDQAADTPDIDEPEERKTAWIFNTIPRIKSKLIEMGLDFKEG